MGRCCVCILLVLHHFVSGRWATLHGTRCDHMFPHLRFIEVWLFRILDFGFNIGVCITRGSSLTVRFLWEELGYCLYGEWDTLHSIFVLDTTTVTLDFT